MWISIVLKKIFFNEIFYIEECTSCCNIFLVLCIDSLNGKASYNYI